MVMVTVPAESAHDLSRAVLRDHLAAGVSIVHNVASIFWWKGQLEEKDEAILFMRTENHLLKALTDRIKEVHPYEVPEITYVTMESENKEYLKWIHEVVLAQKGIARPDPAARTKRFGTVVDVLRAAADTPLKVVVAGAPGSGVRTLGHRIARRLHWKFYSPVEKHLTPQGIDDEAREYVEKGQLIPDEIILKEADPALRDMKSGGVVAGFPRSKAQVGLLQNVWKSPDIVFLLDINENDAASLLKGRLSCPCGMSYGTSIPPRKPGVCDACGEKLFRRSDDQDEEVLKERFRIWTTQTKPLILGNFASALHPLEASKGYKHVMQEASMTLMKVLSDRKASG